MDNPFPHCLDLCHGRILQPQIPDLAAFGFLVFGGFDMLDAPEGMGDL